MRRRPRGRARWLPRSRRNSPRAAAGCSLPYKVPAMIRIVPALEVSAAGKLVRPGA